MRIAVVCDVLGAENNGTTVAAMNLIRFLRGRGHDVRVVCPDEDRRGQAGYYVVPQLNVGPLNDYVRKNGVSIAVTDDAVLDSALRDVNVIHIMTPFFLGKAALEYGRKHGIPVTAGFHAQAENITNHLHLMNSPLANELTYKAMYRLVYQYVNAIHYPTRFIREVFEREVGPTNGYVISNGVNSRFVRTETKRPEEWTDKFVILFTGRYGLEKSHRVLIDAAAKSKYEAKIQLVFAGDGPLRAELEAYGKKLTNPPVMRFFSREEMLGVINGADLYVHPAEIEIEAIACLEAISCGLVPVIADSPRSATRFFALGNNNLFHFNDPDDLKDKIEYWMEHPEEKAICSRAYQGYTRRFEQRHCMEEMEKMLTETAARCAAQPCVLREGELVEVRLLPLTPDDREQFIRDNQEAFNYGALEEFGRVDEHFEEEGEIISRATIEASIDGGAAYRIMLGGEKAGGAVVRVEGGHGDLELLFVSPRVHSRGVGAAAWRAIEAMYPQVSVWETVTPYFEKRNIHFYVNRCGFRIVEFFNARHRDPNEKDGDAFEMFRFEKRIGDK